MADQPVRDLRQLTGVPKQRAGYFNGYDTFLEQRFLFKQGLPETTATTQLQTQASRGVGDPRYQPHFKNCSGLAHARHEVGLELALDCDLGAVSAGSLEPVEEFDPGPGVALGFGLFTEGDQNFPGLRPDHRI